MTSLMRISRKSTTGMVNAMAEARPGQNTVEPIPDPTKTVSEQSADARSPEALQSELADAKDKLLRALAEQQNIRQQMQRQREEAVKFAASQLAGDLLDTLDNLRRAIESVPSEATDHAAIKPLLKGVETTEGNLLATLARHGMQRIDPLGAAFDPHRHHAILQRSDATATEGTVVEVLQPGYMLHERMLRPAMVSVAVRSKKDGSNATE
jgi:molecular chaperone GrpE